MKLRREAKTLKLKALASLRRGLAGFNSFEEDGRVTTVLLHMQHSCEMLLKAVLVQNRIDVFDRVASQSLGFAKCLALAQIRCGLLASEAGVMRTVDALRDAEQHWIVVVDESVLYLHARALVGVMDEILRRNFSDSLADNLPLRVVPISTIPSLDLTVLIDAEFTQIRDLLKPGRRAREEARARIRALLAVESHVAEGSGISEKDINRIETAIREGITIERVFPRLVSVGSSMTGEGFQARVHFSKKEGLPVKFIASDDPTEAAAIREVDLQKKFDISSTSLAQRLSLTAPRSKALRDHLSIDADSDCSHTFTFGRSSHQRFSDNALRKMQACLEAESMDSIWQKMQGNRTALS